MVLMCSPNLWPHAKCAGHLPGLSEVARGSWVVGLQGGEKLCFSWVEEASLAERRHVDWARPNLGDDLAQMLHIVVVDLGSSLHDDGSEQDSVHLALRETKLALLAAEILEKLVTKARVQFLEELCRLQLLVKIVIAIVITGDAHIVQDVAAGVDVQFALKKACGGAVSLSSSNLHSLRSSYGGCITWKMLSGSKRTYTIPSGPC